MLRGRPPQAMKGPARSKQTQSDPADESSRPAKGGATASTTGHRHPATVSDELALQVVEPPSASVQRPTWSSSLHAGAPAHGGTDDGGIDAIDHQIRRVRPKLDLGRPSTQPLGIAAAL